MRIGLLSDEPPDPNIAEAYQRLAEQQREVVESYAVALARCSQKQLDDYAARIRDLYGDWAA